MIITTIVALPEHFDIINHLKYRELADIPDKDKVVEFYDDPVAIAKNALERKYVMDHSMLRTLATSIAKTPISVFTYSKEELFEKLTEIFDDLGLVFYHKVDHWAAVSSRQTGKENVNHLLVCINILNIMKDKKSVEMILENISRLDDFQIDPKILQELKAG